MVRFAKTDACLLIVIAISIFYLYLGEDEQDYLTPIEDDGDGDGEFSDLNVETTSMPPAESSRKCLGTVSVTNELVLDFSYSRLSIPDPNDEIGEDILDQLFNVGIPNPIATAH